MRVGFFGGSFDPPHLGHLAVALAAADAFALQRVLLVPTGRQPLKPSGATAAYADRLAMVQLLCAADARLQASAIEAPEPGEAAEPNYTVDTLERLRAERPQDELFVLVGVDAFLTLDQWRAPERLLELAEWVVVGRPGVAADLAPMTLRPEQLARVHLLPGPLHPASATAVRAALAAGQPCDGLLLPSVWEYIREHGLYA